MRTGAVAASTLTSEHTGALVLNWATQAGINHIMLERL